MAMRGSPARRIVGSPLAGVLGHLDHRARTAARRRPASGPVEDDPPPHEPQPPAPAGPAGTVVVTGDDGRARWTFPAAYGAPPAVTATAVDPTPDDDRTVLVALEEVTAWCVTVRAWRTRARRGTGVAEPAGPGVQVHVIALDAGRSG
ncbi:hypothetical protein [Streptomyces misionensis]|uniref:hypothetical protein n=1 Tax=Streptomyces misionensis TaxID=67331 RepID=UPI0033B956DA